jgi:23S rRNA (uracil1939-C5)-methyltransferase
MNQTVDILSLDHEGHGVARIDGKVTFVDGALAGERAEIAIYRKHAKYNSANAVAILKASAQRTEPRCRYFGRCGGCSMQHLEPSAQVAAKQRVLEENLARIGKVRPDIILPALHGPSWRYRTRARLSARWVDKKGGGLVGFREKRSSFIADMASCEVLTADVSALIQPLRELIGNLSNADRIPQIEVAVGEHVTVLVFRLLEPWSDDDAVLVRAFAEQHRVQIWEQRKGPDTARPFWPDIAPELSYSLPEFGLVMPFRPTEFTQVNTAINRALVSRALRLLDPQPGERVADLFCGLGNFTLPIARSGARCFGIEGSGTGRACARERPAQPVAQRQLCGRQPVRDDAGEVRRARALRQAADRPAAFRGHRGRQVAARLFRVRKRGRAAAHRLRLVRPGHAGARRRGAGSRQGLPAQGRRRRQHVPAHRARGIDRAIRTLIP